MSHRISKEKRAFILAALNEATPINAVCRIFKTGKHQVLRLIAETGEAMAHYMKTEFRDLTCARVEMDEAWSYVFKHGHQGQKTVVREDGMGDYWLWCAVDPDTKLVFSHHIGRRDGEAATAFVEDMTSRVKGPTQYASDPLFMYLRPMLANARQTAGDCYGTETKIFIDPKNPERVIQRARRPRHQEIVKSVRETVFGQTELSLLTTAHVERVFLTVRQELSRFTRLTLAYSKRLDMHCHATALFFATYNLVRRHTSLDGQTPAQAAGVTEKRWTWEDIVSYADAYWQPVRARMTEKKALARRLNEDAIFQAALSELESL